MIIVSACLMGENCKYNGGNNFSEKLSQYLKEKKYLCVCPEVEGGLPVPRNPVEIKSGTVIDKFGNDYTQNFQSGAENCLKKIDDYLKKNPDEKIECAILQARSPSCGKGKIYDGSFTKTLIDGNGIFVQKLLDRGIKCLTLDELLP